MTSVKDQLLSTITEPVSTGKNKITIVGVGQVGMACAFSILTSVSKFQFYQIINSLLYINYKIAHNYSLMLAKMLNAVFFSENVFKAMHQTLLVTSLYFTFI